MYGMIDEYKDMYSLRKWDYYNNGENPNLTGYETKLWNTSVIVDGQLMFQGDLSKERLQFLVNLTEKDRCSIIILNEYAVPQYQITMGWLFRILFKKDKELDRLLLGIPYKESEKVDYPTETNGDLSLRLINYNPKVIRND